MRGLRSRRTELQLLLENISPICVCLQETKIPEDTFIPFKTYQHYFSNLGPNNQGGSAILVRNNIAHSQLPIQTDIQAVAISLAIDHTTYNICSIYLPPSIPFPKQSLLNIIRQLHKPFLILGDFNARHESWGNETHTLRGTILHNIITTSDIIYLNTGSSTHHHFSTN